MSLELLWEKLEDNAINSGMQCGRSDKCDSDCCRPATSGSEPGVTHAEIVLINLFLAKQQEFHFYEAGSDSCKFLGEDGKCRIYAARPIDCRIHFCKKDSLASQPNREAADLVADYHSRYESAFMATELIDSVRFAGEP